MTTPTLGVIFQMRQSGATLQQIGDCFGISRERVRQLLVKRYGSTQVRGLLETGDVVQLASCTYQYIRILKRRGIIKPSMVVGKGRTLWNPKTVDIIIRYRVTQRCQVCNRQLPDNHAVYCSRACWAKAYRHRYKKMSPLARKLHDERVVSWIKSHPEEAIEIGRRKQEKYYAKKSAERFKSNRYIIRAKCPIPLGTTVKAQGSGASKGRLKIEWDNQVIEIPNCCVQKVTKEKE